MQRLGLQLSSPRRFFWFTALFAFIFLGAASATLFASGAASLSAWIIVILVAAVGLLVLAWVPASASTVGMQRLLTHVTYLYLFLEIVWPRYATFRLPSIPS
jgi:hypothetical protein